MGIEPGSVRLEADVEQRILRHFCSYKDSNCYCFRAVEASGGEDIHIDSGDWNLIWLQLCVHPDVNHSFLGGLLIFPIQVQYLMDSSNFGAG